MKHKTFYAALILVFSTLLFNTLLLRLSYGLELFHEKDELIGMFKELCDAYPEYASYASIGKTYEGRDIWIFRIGNPDGGRVLWDGQLHGNEDKGSEIIYLITEWLLESGDPRALKVLERNYALFIPVVNMDSYERGNRDFRNCRYGVDLNRNFEVGWSRISCTSSQVYSGPSPASEPETKALKEAFEEYKPDFYVNTHCGAGPYLSYYIGGDRSLALETVSRIRSVSYDMGITPYPVRTMGSNGFAIGDAGRIGISSWLIELEGSGTCWSHTSRLYQDLVNIYYPKCLAIFLAMCQVCEIEPPPYTTKTFEIFLNGNTFEVVTESDSIISDFNFNEHDLSLEFTATDQTGITGFTNVTIPDDLLSGKFSIYNNGYYLETGVDYTHNHNATHYFFDIKYSQTINDIEIIGTHGIPEFPTGSPFLLVPTVILSITILFILLKRHRQPLQEPTSTI
jgi:hypothetical protein